MTKAHRQQNPRVTAEAARATLPVPRDPKRHVISESALVSATAALESGFSRTFLARLRQVIACIALLGMMLSALGQNDLQGNAQRLNSTPPDSALTDSNRAANSAAYKTALTAVRSDQQWPGVMVELAIELARDKDLEIRQIGIGALLPVEPYLSPSGRASCGRLGEKLFRPMLDATGIEPQPGESVAVLSWHWELFVQPKTPYLTRLAAAPPSDETHRRSKLE